MDVIEQAEAVRIRGLLPRVFTPAAPVSRGELFAGRNEQVQRVLGAVASPGQHAIIFGERGVGKTSLASLIHYFWQASFHDSEIVTPWITCDTTDTFGTIWAKVLEATTDNFEIPSITAANGSDIISAVMEEINAAAATPDQVRRFFALAGSQFVVTIDEFDRVIDHDSRILLADTIKSLADHHVNATLVLVGVADTVTDLIEDHASIGRNLAQVLMPRMALDELEDIVLRGLSRVDMTIDPTALTAIASLSQGLPHYTHLLGLNASINAIQNGRKRVKMDDTGTAINASVASAQQSIVASYHAATFSTKPHALFRQVLLACALTYGDDLAYFAPKEVAEPLSHITGKTYDVPNFIQHLHAFCDEERASVLESTGSKYKQKYRFTDPLLRPYVMLRGIREGMVEADYVLHRA